MSIDIALYVKSLRLASSSHERTNSTSACLPSVFVSARRVVISKSSPSITAVIVPCSMPVGICLMPALSSIAIISSGVASVAKSISFGSLPNAISLTAPPTILTSC